MNTTPDLHNLTADFSSNKSGKWDQFSSPAKRPGEDGPLHNRRLTTEVDSEALETDRPLMKTGYRPGQNLFTDMGDVDNQSWQWYTTFEEEAHPEDIWGAPPVT